MKYTIFQNMIYLYKEVFRKTPISKLYIGLNAVTELGTPLLGIFTTSYVVYSLTSSDNVSSYLWNILILVSFTMMFEIVRSASFVQYNFENTFTRTKSFFLQLAEHQITTDFENIQPKQKQKMVGKAYEAINSNWSGIELMMKSSPKMLINLVGMLIYGTFVLLFSPVVLIILIVMSVVNLLFVVHASKHLKHNREKMNDEFYEQYYLSEDSTNPNYAKDIRLYQMDKWFSKLLHQLTVRRVKLETKVRKRFFMADFSNSIFLLLRDVVAYTVLIRQVVEGNIDLATFTFLVGIVAGFSVWLQSFVESSNSLRVANVSVNEYRDFLEVESKVHSNHTIDFEFPLKISFEHVTFTYPDNELPTIEDMSFTIQPGEKIALVGHNGAGKTTIIYLLCGLFTPDSGVIRINDVDIQTMSKQQLRNLIGVMFQDTQLLSLTVKNNITCSVEEDVDYDVFYDVLQKAGVYDKVMSLPDKEDTYVTKLFDLSGVRFSGGETQKLLLARALYKNAPILILDEPTASLDPIAEEEMYKKYDELVYQKTSIFISHRLSSTSFCDRIFFLENAKIIEVGSHEELLLKKGRYFELFQVQSKYYQEEDTYETNQA